MFSAQWLTSDNSIPGAKQRSVMYTCMRPAAIATGESVKYAGGEMISGRNLTFFISNRILQILNLLFRQITLNVRNQAAIALQTNTKHTDRPDVSFMLI